MRLKLLLPVVASLLSACAAVDDLRTRLRGETPHEDYRNALESAGLLATALGQDWVNAAQHALSKPLPADVPVEETGYLDPAEPAAIGVALQLERGQRVTVNADLRPTADAQLFIDVFRIDPESTAPRHVAAADSGGRSLEFEPSRDGQYVVRLQPELLRGGRYTLTVRAGPALAFPVHGAGSRAVGSGFGAPRDGGARDHHGIDIFAPRGTPVLAVAPGVVNRVRETPRGGKVVWLRDERRGISVYYAHLDQQLVESGASVEIGDTLGLVGNTGNARSTPPHLHFGIYRRGEGAVDPLPYVRPRNNTLPPLRADTAWLGSWARTSASLQIGERRLDADTPLRLHGASAARFRAELPDGTLLWIDADDVERAQNAVTVARARRGCLLRAQPAPNAAIVTELSSRARLSVLGTFEQFRFVQADSLRGWTDCV